MARIVSTKLVIVGTDTNNETVEYSISNINPAISDTSVLRTAAQRINGLSNLSLNEVFTEQRIDITND